MPELPSALPLPELDGDNITGGEDVDFEEDEHMEVNEIITLGMILGLLSQVTLTCQVQALAMTIPVLLLE